ncbi:MAG TPA: ClbS/DfsB family four-helix bundle protein [Bacteroidota bacterium]|nr:ClbS/DfsB family four-helix bundle protein [Bacteroidota bacterium]
MTKEDLLQLIQAEWQRLVDAIAKVPATERESPGFPGSWSVKDLMAHLSSWETVVLERLGRIKRGEAVEPITADQREQWNKEFFEQHRSWKLLSVEGEFENIHAQLVKHITAMEDAVWDRDEQGIRDWLVENTFAHYAHHRARLETALRQRQPDYHQEKQLT